MWPNDKPTMIEQLHIDIFGEIDGQIFHELYIRVHWLHTKWTQYSTLFRSKEGTRLFKSIAPQFFHTLITVLLDDLILHVARITDPPGKRAQENVTVQMLPNMISDDHTKQLVQTELNHIKQRIGPIREWRNKVVAHVDLTTALIDPGLDDLPTVEDIEFIIERIDRIFNHLYREHDYQISFDAMPSLVGEIKQFIRHLRQGTGKG